MIKFSPHTAVLRGVPWRAEEEGSQPERLATGGHHMTGGAEEGWGDDDDLHHSASCRMGKPFEGEHIGTNILIRKCLTCVAPHQGGVGLLRCRRSACFLRSQYVLR